MAIEQHKKSSLQSAVETDLPNTEALPKTAPYVQPELKEEAAPVVAAPVAPALSAEQKAHLDAVNKHVETRANDHGIGLVKVDGIGLNYIGVAPARDKKAETPSGYPITPENSTFTPLANVPFSNSIKIKDPSSGEYYYAQDGVTTWDQCELNGSQLIPNEASKEGIKARKDGVLAT